MAGANVAMMTSALLRHGIEHAQLVLSQLTRWMEEHEYESIRQMRGSMSYHLCVPSGGFRAGQLHESVKFICIALSSLARACPNRRPTPDTS